MALSFSLVTEGESTTDTTVYTTASVSPTSNNLLLLSTVSGDNSGGENPLPPTVTGLGLTWTLIRSATNGSFTQRIALYVAQGTVTPGTLTLTHPTTHHCCAWRLVQVSGATVGNGGQDALVQSNSNTTLSGQVSVSLSAVTSGNATYGVFSQNSTSNAVVVGAGFTEIGDQTATNPGGPSTRLTNEYSLTGTNPVVFDHNDALEGVAIGAEIEAVPAPVHNGAVAMTGTGALSSTARLTAMAGSAPSGAGSLLSAALLDAIAAAALSGTGGLSAVGVKTQLGAAALSGTGALSSDTRFLGRYGQQVLIDGPIAYWPMSDYETPTDSVDAVDIIGGLVAHAQGDDPTLGVPTFVVGDLPYDQYVGSNDTTGDGWQADDEALLPTTPTPLGPTTLEIVVQVEPGDLAGAAHAAFLVLDQTSRGLAMGWVGTGMDAGKPFAEAANGGDVFDIFGPASIADGNPHHLALVYNGAGRVDFYVDGVNVANDTLSPAAIVLFNVQDISIAWSDFALSGRGLFAHAAIYDYALSATQIRMHAANTTALTWFGGTAMTGAGDLSVVRTIGWFKRPIVPSSWTVTPLDDPSGWVVS